jgi:hypothetical protein
VGNLYLFQVIGVNLQGAIASAAGAEVFGLDNTNDAFMSGFVRVGPDAPAGPISLTIRGTSGTPVEVPLLVQSSSSLITKATSPGLTDKDGTPIFYRQSLSSRPNIGGTQTAASSLSSSDFCVTLEVQRVLVSAEASHTFFKNPGTGLFEPIADSVFLNLPVGQKLRLETLTFSFWAYIELRIFARFCSGPLGDLGFDIVVCSAGELGIHVPVVGGSRLTFEFCFGTDGPSLEFNLEGTGRLNFLRFHRRGGSGPEPLQCTRITDLTSDPYTGRREFEVERLSDCCSEEVGVEWDGDFYIGQMSASSQRAGIVPHASTQCSPLVPGSGDSTAVVMLSGFSADSSDEPSGMECLLERIHGSIPFDPTLPLVTRVFQHSQAEQALQWVLNHVSPNACVLIVGHSLGGREAIGLAIKLRNTHNRSVRGVYTIDPVNGWPGRNPPLELPPDFGRAVNLFQTTRDWFEPEPVIVIGALNINVEGLGVPTLCCGRAPATPPTEFTHTNIDDSCQVMSFIIDEIRNSRRRP